MRVAITSDWHGYLPPDVPECDLMLVAGDIGVRADGGFENFSVGDPTLLYADLRAWILMQPFPIVAIAGNHDFNTNVLASLPWTFLQDEAAVIDSVKIWGTPWSNPFGHGWAFNMTEEDQAENLDKCPDDANIIVSHGPPYGLCDLTPRSRWGEPRHVGSKALRGRMDELGKLSLVACGHVHPAYGVELDWDSVVVSNGSLVNEEYRVANATIVVEL